MVDYYDRDAISYNSKYVKYKMFTKVRYGNIGKEDQNAGKSKKKIQHTITKETARGKSEFQHPARS